MFFPDYNSDLGKYNVTKKYINIGADIYNLVLVYKIHCTFLFLSWLSLDSFLSL